MKAQTTLADGTRVLFRPVRPDDKERLVEGFARLSPESRYRRFFRSIDRLTETQLRYLTELDYVDHVAVIAVLPDEPAEPAIAIGRWVRARAEPTVAEAAVTVGDAYQNKGLGKTILFLLARSAIAQGVRSFRAYTLGHNDTMLAILRGLGAVPGRWDSGVLEVSVPLPDDVNVLDQTPAPLLLRAAASEQVVLGPKEDVARSRIKRPGGSA
ncbi:MAG: GNAT family N-acetyltransferase [Actinomycetota bacterium]